MTVPSYRLDTVAAALIERLEGARPSYSDRPRPAAEAFERITEEHLSQVIAEHDEVMGRSGWGDVLRREIHETFLPRYTRLALDHNELEEAGYKAWRQGDPVARIVSTVAALLFAVLIVRLVHHPVVLPVLGVVVLVPFIPELRRWYYRRQYASLLQEVIDDLARVQEQLESYAPTELEDITSQHGTGAVDKEPHSVQPAKEDDSTRPPTQARPTARDAGKEPPT